MAVLWVTVAALAATALGVTITPVEQNGTKLPVKSSCGMVWVTVHSPELRVGTVRTENPLELNWDFSGCPTAPAQIGLFYGWPASWSNAVAAYVISSIQGYIVTNISLGNFELPNNWHNGRGISGPACLWPWVAAGSRTSFDTMNCLKIQPTWMQDSSASINRLRIGELAIPGTHNAGAWRFNTEVSTAARDSFVLCQDQSIWAQLVFGIRYFDFRIGYYEIYNNVDDRYWLNHNLIRVRPLVPLLREIRSFLDNTNEVIFLDAHHFPVGFYQQDGSPIWHVHTGLLQIIQRELGPHLALAIQFGTGIGTRGPTMQSLLDANKRLVFSYVDNSVVAANNWLWPNLPQLWANTNSPTDLFRFLDQAIANSPTSNARSPLFSAMAQTTPSVLDILLLRGSIRENADAVNRHVTLRLIYQWRQRSNIIASDFFLGNDVIEQSIAISNERGSRL